MHFDWWTLALQIVNFGILVWLLHRFLYKPVLRMIDARKAEIEKQFADVRAAEDHAKTALAAADAERAGIAAERAAALKAAAVQAEEAATARRGQAEREAAALLDGARETIAKEREQALAEARRVALDLGVEVARKLLDEVPTELRAEAWLERVEQHLATLAPAEREELRKGLDGSGAVRAVTATPLPEPVITEWRNRLRKALGDGVTIDFEADPALVAGVELHLPSAVLRYSWSSVVAAMRAEIEAHDNTH
jgi:F-type H+-transporting ATPase subunit b